MRHNAPLAFFVLILLLALPPRAVQAATITVTGTGDTIALDGVVTLREAITAANNNAASGDAPAGSAGLDTITFNIPGAGVQTINLTAALPIISESLVIDGLTQPGASCAAWPPTLLIELNGAGAPIGTTGLEITASSSTIRGLVINRFRANLVPFPPVGGIGVRITGVGATGNSVQCNFIGTNAAGTAALANEGPGVTIDNGPTNNIIGGATNDKRNLVSGNLSWGNNGGVGIGAANGNFVENNYIGTNAAGTAAIGNRDGIYLFLADSNAIARNLISGNTDDGINIASSNNNDATNNLIGTNAAGTAALPNVDDGIHISFQVIGTSTANGIASNVISGNGQQGVLIDNAASTGNLLIDNEIGSNLAGTVAIPNGQEGVAIATGASNNAIGTNNIIAYNGGAGVTVTGGGTGNSILVNSIFSNGGLGIDLGANGVTPNDAGDADTGSNGLQNFPVITSATTTTIAGTLNSIATRAFRIDFYASAVCDPSNFGEGQTHLGFLPSVNTNAAGNATFSFGGTFTAGQFITAVALDNTNSNTSEFSQCVQVVAPGSGTVQFNPATLLSVSETAGSVTLSVELVVSGGTLVGAATVNVAFTGTASGGGVDYTGVPGTLNFGTNLAPGTYTQNITLNLVDDALVESPETVIMTLNTPGSGVSIGANNARTVEITSNDLPGVTVTAPGSATLNELGAPSSTTFTVRLDSQPTASVNFNLTASDNTECTVLPPTLTFTAANWNTPQTVTITAVDDFVDDGNQPCAAQIAAASSADSSYNGINPPDPSVSVIDNDTSGATVAQSGGSTDVNEAGPSSDSYTFVLNTQPTANVTITITPDAQCTALPATLTFTPANWNIPQAVTITAVDDANVEASPHPCLIAHTFASADLLYNALAAVNVTANVGDNDGPGATLAQSGGSTLVNEAGPSSDSYTLVLNTLPSADVTISIVPDAQCTALPSALTFTTANWNIAQTVTVTAVDDAVIEAAAHPCVVTHTFASADAAYNALAAVNLSVLVGDNDGLPPTATVVPAPTATPPPPDQPQPSIAVFDPAISKIGFLLPGQVGVTGERLEWVITVSNSGSVVGQNVVVSDTLRPELRIDSVTTSLGTFAISGQTVTFTLGTLNPGQTVQISIFTTVLQSGIEVDNSACVAADNQGGIECALASAVRALPATGETPLWALWLVALAGSALFAAGLLARIRAR
ncbi:MAG: right-handed parallel beta-helix repeat-containing protein [Chloroflexi bacterium]|nr:right-handed parallel beta-helix repeat-containing protein [Chloroflexota bacterium]